MPEEFSRTTARKQITLPNGGKVNIPVITKISFIDPFSRHQETQATVDNSHNSNRDVHVDSVVSTSGASGTLSVERIDRWKVFDQQDRGQETEFELDNVTGASSIPPHFTSHQKTHIVRYRNQDDPDVWVDSELIDELAVVDPFERHQETVWILNNPQTDDDAQADPIDPDITDAGDVSSFRTDPFQNIIDWSDGSETIPSSYAYFSHSPSADIPPSDIYAGAWTYLNNQSGVYPGVAFAGDLDLRYVDQYFSPHTYDGFDLGTADVRGYSIYEWTVGFSPGGFDSWYEQMQAYWLAGGFPARINSPNMLDFKPYGFFEYLKPFYTAFYNAVRYGTPPLQSYYVRVRMTAIGSTNTANPSGRY